VAETYVVSYGYPPFEKPRGGTGFSWRFTRLSTGYRFGDGQVMPGQLGIVAQVERKVVDPTCLRDIVSRVRKRKTRCEPISGGSYVYIVGMILVKY